MPRRWATSTSTLIASCCIIDPRSRVLEEQGTAARPSRYLIHIRTNIRTSYRKMPRRHKCQRNEACGPEASLRPTDQLSPPANTTTSRYQMLRRDATTCRGLKQRRYLQGPANKACLLSGAGGPSHWDNLGPALHLRLSGHSTSREEGLLVPLVPEAIPK